MRRVLVRKEPKDKKICSKTRNGYVLDKDGSFAHRVVYEIHHGKIPARYHIHHINCRKLDNRIENLIAIPAGLHRNIHKMMRGSPETIILRPAIERMLVVWKENIVRCRAEYEDLLARGVSSGKRYNQLRIVLGISKRKKRRFGPKKKNKQKELKKKIKKKIAAWNRKYK